MNSVSILSPINGISKFARAYLTCFIFYVISLIDYESSSNTSICINSLILLIDVDKTRTLNNQLTMTFHKFLTEIAFKLPIYEEKQKKNNQSALTYADRNSTSIPNDKHQFNPLSSSSISCVMCEQL